MFVDGLGTQSFYPFSSQFISEKQKEIDEIKQKINTLDDDLQSYVKEFDGVAALLPKTCVEELKTPYKVTMQPSTADLSPKYAAAVKEEYGLKASLRNWDNKIKRTKLEKEKLESKRNLNVTLISEAEDFLSILEKNPETIYQFVLNYLSSNLQKYDDDEDEIGIEQIPLVELQAAVKYFRNIKTNDKEETRLRLAQLAGAIWTKFYDVERFNSASKFKNILRQALNFLHVESSHNLPNKSAIIDGNVCEMFKDLQTVTPEVFSKSYKDVKDDNFAKYTAAKDSLQNTIVTLRDIPIYKSFTHASQNLLNEINMRVERYRASDNIADYVDVRCYTRALKLNNQLLNKPTDNDAVLKKFLTIAENHVGEHGLPRPFKIAAGVFIAVGIIGIIVGSIFTCGAFGLIAGVVAATVIAKISAISMVVGGATMIGSGASLMHKSRVSGVPKLMNNVVESVSKVSDQPKWNFTTFKPAPKKQNVEPVVPRLVTV